MSGVVDILCIRIQSELNRYENTRTVPHDLLEGAFSIDDIKECMSYYSPKHKRLANKLIKEYEVFIEKNIDHLRKNLRREYKTTMDMLETAGSDFMFPTVLTKYRTDINPARALYYDTREMFRRFNPENEIHHWLLELITDKEFNNKLLDAIARDIKRLERIISRYYWPFTKHDDNIPLELFHARQLMKDFRHYYNFFMSAQLWSPDE